MANLVPFKTPNGGTVQYCYVVLEHDQGRTEECETFDSRAAARHYIEDRLADQEVHPQWYRHLANPSYEISKRVDRSEPIFMHYEVESFC